MPGRGARWSLCGSARWMIRRQCPPDIHIFTATKQPWLVLDDRVPVVPEYYDRKVYWPAASLARREVMRGKA